MGVEGHTVLVSLPEALASRMRTGLATGGIRVVEIPETAGPAATLAGCASAPVDVVFLGSRPDGSEAEVCAVLRRIGIPSILLASVSGPLQVNAVRKSSGANLALGSAFTDADARAAVKSLAAPVGSRSAVRQAVQLPPPTPKGEEDPAWAIARYGLRNTTGSLRVGARTGTAECMITFTGGTPVSAASNVRGARLGEMFVRKRRLTAEQIERAMRVVEKKSLKLGAVLMDQGLVTREEVLAEVGAQYVARVLTVFAWPAVVTTVRHEASPADEVRIPLTREALVLEGVRRQYDLARLQAILPETSAFAFSPDAGLRFSLFGFSAEEAAVFLGLDGMSPVSEIVTRTGRPLEALRALYAAAAFDLLRPAKSPLG